MFFQFPVVQTVKCPYNVSYLCKKIQISIKSFGHLLKRPNFEFLWETIFACKFDFPHNTGKTITRLFILSKNFSPFDMNSSSEIMQNTMIVTRSRESIVIFNINTFQFRITHLAAARPLVGRLLMQKLFWKWRWTHYRDHQCPFCWNSSLGWWLSVVTLF